MKPNQWCDDDYGEDLVEKSPTNRFFIRMSLSSLIVGVLLIGGLTLWHPNLAAALGMHRPMTMLEHSGAVILNAQQLESHISLPMHAGHHRYWFGPMSGNSYTTNCVSPGILKVDYFRANQLRANQDSTDGSMPFISVTAYESTAVFNARLTALTGNSPTITSNSRGDMLSFDATSLQSLTIFPASSTEVITIEYATPQSSMSLIRDSQILVKL